MPLHKKRRWVIQPAESAAWLADQLIDHCWCSCQGWSLGGYLFLNDQTSADGAFEVAIVKPPAGEGGQWFQVESVTFGWLRTNYKLTAIEQARNCIEAAIAGRLDPGPPGSVAWPTDPCRIETVEQHGRCEHCAEIPGTLDDPGRTRSKDLYLRNYHGQETKAHRDERERVRTRHA